mmetsp:Transcript_24494/g.51470  ORF Transcript_24494/g.51470 Transcript_24494/m.51470 type:complete len:249 (+) Transcript_24494:917-1663(+)
MLYVADIKTVNQFYGVFGPLWGGRKCSRCRRRKRLFVEIMHELVKTKEGDSEPMKILRVKQSSVLFFCILQETRLIGSSSTLRLVLGNRRSSTTNLLALVLGLLDSLTTLFLLLLKSLADKSVFRLELTQCILCIVDHTESGGLSSSEFSSETEKNYQFGIRLVHASDDLLQFSAGNIGASGVDDVDNHLRAVREKLQGLAKVKGIRKKSPLIVRTARGCHRCFFQLPCPGSSSPRKVPSTSCRYDEQ